MQPQVIRAHKEWDELSPSGKKDRRAKIKAAFSNLAKVVEDVCDFVTIEYKVKGKIILYI